MQIQGASMARRKRPPQGPKEERSPATVETFLKLARYYPASLAPELHQAATAIEAAHKALCAKLRPQAAALAPASPGKAEMSDGKADLVSRYLEWARQVSDRRILLGPVLRVVIEGMEPRECDWRWHREAGVTAGHVLEALKLWARVERGQGRRPIDAGPPRGYTQGRS